MFVLVGIFFGIIYGQISAHRPAWRRVLVYLLFGLTTCSWILVLSFPGRAPYWSLFLLFFILGVSGPGSMLAFDFTKTSVPKVRMGSANGFVNIGLFLASFAMVFLIGTLLDLFHAFNRDYPLYSVEGFRFALPIQFVVTGFGIIMFSRESSKSKAETVGILE
jgi:sugar phosphate permease